jgi:dihydrofolate reductase
MRRLVAFNQVTLDGYFSGLDGDISWARKDAADEEWSAFVAGNARGAGVLLFGRITYELMASFWPTPLALERDPVVARQMNDLPKIVFSRTLTEVSWQNTKLITGTLAAEVRRLKNEPGEDMAILGSGSIVSQLAREGLIDEYQMVVNPVVLGSGQTAFQGVTQRLTLKLTKTRSFANGNVLLCYAPAV